MSGAFAYDWFTGILLMLMGSASSDDDEDDDDIPAGQCCKRPRIVEREYRDEAGNYVSESECKNCGWTDRYVRYW